MTDKKIIALRNNAITALKQKNYQLAHQKLLEILQVDRDYADAFFLLSKIPLENGNVKKAIELIERAIKISPKNTEYHVAMIKCLTIHGDTKETIKWIEKSITLKFKSSTDYNSLGVAYSFVGNHLQAKLMFEQAILINNNAADYYFNLASSLKFLGDFESAKDALEKAITISPKHYRSHSSLSSLGGISTQHNHIVRLKKLLTGVDNPVDMLYLSHALSLEYESLHQYDKSFQVLKKAKQQRMKQLNYNFTIDNNMFNSISNIFTDKNIKFSSGFDSDEAIFVVGMPRTGTTVVERIISNHSRVKSAGELHNFERLLRKEASIEGKLLNNDSVLRATKINYYNLGQAYIKSVRPLVGSCGKFVDKLPLNILLAGFIIKALPNCKIICLDRNPLDTIVSNYRQMFSTGYSSCNYSNSLKSTALYYVQFKKMLSLWQVLFPNNFYLVNYEKLVNNPEDEGKEIITSCGLQWQSQCVDIQNNTTAVATASALQVRQPINNNSIGNWKKYHHYLDEVKHILRMSGVN